jgi:hypothetical protein
MIRNLVNFDLEEVTPEVKAEYLKRIVEGITNPCKILVREGKPGVEVKFSTLTTT